GLRGSRAKDVKRKGLPSNPAFGCLAGVPEDAIQRAIDDLLAAGRLVPKGRKYPTLWVAGKAVRPRRAPSGRRPAKPALVRALEALRSREARRRRWRAYQVFDNRTLEGIVAARPDSLEALLAVP